MGVRKCRGHKHVVRVFVKCSLCVDVDKYYDDHDDHDEVVSLLT